jgi:hypothetical protein
MLQQEMFIFAKCTFCHSRQWGLEFGKNLTSPCCQFCLPGIIIWSPQLFTFAFFGNCHRQSSPFAPCTRLRKIHAPTLGACENTSHMWCEYTWARLVCPNSSLPVVTFIHHHTLFSSLSTFLLNITHFKPHVDLSRLRLLVSVTFTAGGGFFIFLGVFLNFNLMYAGIVFCVVGGISLCCQCANCSSLNMPLVLVYQ